MSLRYIECPTVGTGTMDDPRRPLIHDALIASGKPMATSVEDRGATMLVAVDCDDLLFAVISKLVGVQQKTAIQARSMLRQRDGAAEADWLRCDAFSPEKPEGR